MNTAGANKAKKLINDFNKSLTEYKNLLSGFNTSSIRNSKFNNTFFLGLESGKVIKNWSDDLLPLRKFLTSAVYMYYSCKFALKLYVHNGFPKPDQVGYFCDTEVNTLLILTISKRLIEDIGKILEVVENL